jgi:uncharacterized protein (TIGR01370 family)
MKKHWLAATFLAWFMQLFHLEAASPPPRKWVVYFAENLPNEIFAPYSLIVLEEDNRPDLSWFLENGKTVLGYLSIGEVSYLRPYYKEVEKEGLLLQVNPNWPDSRMIDVRNKLWTKRVIEQLIPNLLFQRFSGLFLDTADNAAYLEEKAPRKYAGMKDAMVNLIKTIRLHYPEMPIMLNRGIDLLPQVAKDINIVVAENILVDHDFENNTDKFVPDEQYQNDVKRLKEAQKINPKLEVYTLDYWNPKDTEGIKKIYAIQRKNGFNPYVSTVELNKIIPEPQ